MLKLVQHDDLFFATLNTMGSLRKLISTLPFIGRKNFTPLRIKKTHHYPSFYAKVTDIVSHILLKKPKKKSIKELISGKLTFRTWTLVVSTFLLVGIGYLLFGRIVQIYKQASGADPVAYWKFDEGQGGVAKNSIDTGKKGFLSTPTASFASKVDYTTGSSPKNVTINDLNGDLMADLAIANAGSTSVSVFMNNGDGTFASKVDYTVGNNPYAVASGDVDKDGYKDLAVVNQSSPYGISILLNEGDGTFAPRVDYTSATQPEVIAMSDVNDDTWLDLIVGNLGDDVISVFINDGDGTFAPKVDYSTPTNTFPKEVAVGDLNNDSMPDIVTTYSGSPYAVAVFINNGDGTFATKVEYTPGSQPGDVAIGDVNNDGYNDIAFGRASSNTSVYINNGDGTFTTLLTFSAGGVVMGIDIGDFNGDGYADLTTANRSTNTLSVYLNKGNNSFATKVDYSLGTFPEDVTVGDVTGDGKPDIVAVNRDSTSVSVFINNMSPPSWQQEEQCISGKCIRFDGTNDYVAAGSLGSDSLTGDYTISVWLKTSSTGTTEVISNEGTNGDWTHALYFSTDNLLYCKLYQSNSGTAYLEAVSSKNYRDNRWHHVSCVVSSNTVSLYVDGEQVGTDTTTSGTRDTSTAGDLYIGQFNNSSSGLYFFKGVLDEIKIYDYARSAAQIKADYAGGTAGLSAVLGLDDQGFLSDGLVGYWKMDEVGVSGSNWTAIDSSGNGNNGTGVGNASVGSTIPGKFGSAGYFDGDGDYLSFSANSVYQISGDVSTGAWIYPSSNPVDSNKTIVRVGIGSDELFGFQLNSSNKIRFDWYDGSFHSEVGNMTVATDQWSHIMVVRNRNNIKIYINGVLDISVDTGTTPVGANPVLRIGSGAATQDFTGFIDEVRIYNRVLSADEVQALYNWAPGPVGYWKLDENEDSTAIDSSGRGNNLTINGPNWTKGRLGQGLSFDGVDDYLTRTDDDDFDFNASDNFTVETWFKATTPQAAAGEISFTNLGSSSGTSETTPDIRTSADDDASPGEPYSNTSWTPPTSGLIIAFAFNSSPSCGSVPTMSGNSLTWLMIDSDCVDPGQSNRITLFAADATGATTGSNSITFADESPINLTVSFFHAEGVDLSGGVAAAFVQTQTNNGSGTSGSVSLSAAANSGNRPIAAFYHKASEATTPDADWTEADDMNITGPTNGAETQWKSDGFESASASWSTSEQWIGMAAELSVESSGQPHILSKYDTSGSNGGYKLYMENDGDITCGVDTNNSGFPLDSVTSTEATYDDNQWHHLACIKDNSGMHLYIDGVKVASDTSITTTGTYANDKALYIGTNGDGVSNPWHGSLDNIKIYNYARTQQQVVQSMNGDHPAPGSPIGSAVVHYRLDEGYGTTINNVGNAGIGSSGVFGTGNSAPIWSNDGKFGKAIRFDGTGDFIRVGSTAGLNLTGDMTISVWIKSDVAQANKGIVGKYSSTGNQRGYLLASENLAASRKITWIYQQNTGSFSSAQTLTSTSNVLDGTWKHIVVTYEPSTRAAIYINGKLDAETTANVPSSIASNTANFVIGNHDTSAANSFNGLIDEIKVYNFAFTNEQVLIEYNQGKAIVLGAGSTGVGGTSPSNSASREYCIPGDNSECNSPVGEWLFDEGSGTTAYSTSGTGNGTMNNFTGRFGWSQGKFGGAMLFDGSDDRIEINSSGPIGTDTTFSISAWVYPDPAYSTEGTIYCECNANGATRNFFIVLSDGKIRLDQYEPSGGPMDSTASIPFGQWSHIAYSRNGSTEYLFINGVLDSSSTGVENFSGTILGEPTKTTIGVRYSNTAGNYSLWFNGKIDQLRAYNYYRTPAQIAWEYNQGQPVAWYRLDECTGTTAYNAIKNADGKAMGGNGTITIGSSGDQTSAGTCSSGTGTQAWNNGTTGKFNSSLHFDGVDDYIEIADDPMHELEFPFSITAWIKLDSLPSSTGDHYSIISKYKANTNDREWRFTVTTSSNRLNFLTSTNGSASESELSDTSLTNDLGKWVHVAVSADASGTISFYRNGIYDGGGTYSSTIINNSDATTTIGAVAHSSTTPDMFFDGQIDEVKIYRYNLTHEQVKTDMAGGAVRFQ